MAKPKKKKQAPRKAVKNKAKSKAGGARKATVKKKAVVKKKKIVKKAKKSAKPARKAQTKKVRKKALKKARPVKKKKAKAAMPVKKAAQAKPAKKAVVKPASVQRGRKRQSSRSSEPRQPEKFVLPPLPVRPTPTYTPMKQRPDVMMVPKSSEAPGKKRYSDSELKEFKEIILAKLADARTELNNLQASLLHTNDHGTDDTATTFKMLEDGSDTLAKEEAGQLAVRQRKFVDQLENALVRIENKTYGICRVTGKLIPKERLRAVPHTTQSIEAKMQQYRD